MISPDRFPRQAQGGYVGGTTVPGTVVTASGTIHTKGSWTSLVTSAAFDVYYLQVIVGASNTSGTATAQLLDIGYDASGGTTYSVVVPNILAGHAVRNIGGDFNRTMAFPVFIPEGSQIAARIQALIASDTLEVGLQLVGGRGRTHRLRGELKDYGTNLATSNGTAMTNSASANAKGAWTQLGADTIRRHSGLVVALSGADSSIGANRHYVDIGIDPTGGTTWTVVIPDIPVGSNTNEAINYNDVGCFLQAIEIPAGAAIAARSQCQAANVNNDLHVAAYGF